MTWNIHGALGRNSRFDLARVVALIRRWSPDIIALQEVDSRRPLPDGINPFLVLQNALGKHGIGAMSISTTDGDYGQMLISCCPILDSSVHDISWPEREPRRAIMAEIAYRRPNCRNGLHAGFRRNLSWSRRSETKSRRRLPIERGPA